MCLLRRMVLKSMFINCRISGKHVRGIFNVKADQLSRFQVVQEVLSRYNLDPTPEDLHPDLLPQNYAAD